MKTSLKQNSFGLIQSATVLFGDGKIRRVSYIAKSADTWFSITASQNVKGKKVQGYVTFDDGNLTKGIPEGGAYIFRPMCEEAQKTKNLCPANWYWESKI